MRGGPVPAGEKLPRLRGRLQLLIALVRSAVGSQPPAGNRKCGLERHLLGGGLFLPFLAMPVLGKLWLLSTVLAGLRLRSILPTPLNAGV